MGGYWEYSGYNYGIDYTVPFLRRINCGYKHLMEIWWGWNIFKHVLVVYDIQWDTTNQHDFVVFLEMGYTSQNGHLKREHD